MPASNLELVEYACDLAKKAGRPIAMLKEAIEMVGI
jgi:uncharacterized protein (DUF849 family)